MQTLNPLTRQDKVMIIFYLRAVKRADVLDTYMLKIVFCMFWNVVQNLKFFLKIICFL